MDLLSCSKYGCFLYQWITKQDDLGVNVNKISQLFILDILIIIMSTQPVNIWSAKAIDLRPFGLREGSPSIHSTQSCRCISKFNSNITSFAQKWVRSWILVSYLIVKFTSKFQFFIYKNTLISNIYFMWVILYIKFKNT